MHHITTTTTAAAAAATTVTVTVTVTYMCNHSCLIGASASQKPAGIPVITAVLLNTEQGY
jgi:hypothetical protein